MKFLSTRKSVQASRVSQPKPNARRKKPLGYVDLVRESSLRPKRHGHKRLRLLCVSPQAHILPVGGNASRATCPAREMVCSQGESKLNRLATTNNFRMLMCCPLLLCCVFTCLTLFCGEMFESSCCVVVEDQENLNHSRGSNSCQFARILL